MSSPEGSKPKLVFLWTYTKWGGSQVYFFGVMKLARAKGWEVIAVLPKESSPDLVTQLERLGVTCEFLTAKFDAKEEATIHGKVRRQFERIRAEINAYRYLRRFNVDSSVFQVDVGPWQSWQLLTLLSLRKANVFLTVHNFRPEAPGWRRLVWRCRFFLVSHLPKLRIFASNEFAKACLADWIPSDRIESVRVIPTSVDPIVVEKALRLEMDIRADRKRLGIDPDDFVVLVVGQFIDRKGRWVLLEAAQKLADCGDISFIWLMPEPICPEDESRVANYQLGGRFFPVLSSDIGVERSNILGFFRIADAFALPSFVEGLPGALLEAMAMGIPSISTNVYAIPEVVIDGKTGLLIEAGHVDALASAIRTLKKDQTLRATLAEGGRRFVRQNFDERKAAARYLTAYEESLQQKPSDPPNLA